MSCICRSRLFWDVSNRFGPDYYPGGVLRVVQDVSLVGSGRRGEGTVPPTHVAAIVKAGRKKRQSSNHDELHHYLPSASLCTASIVCEVALHCTLHRSFRPITCPHGLACSASKRRSPHHDSTTRPRLCPQASAVRTR
jgi:hypothetical protein